MPRPELGVVDESCRAGRATRPRLPGRLPGDLLADEGGRSAVAAVVEPVGEHEPRQVVVGGGGDRGEEGVAVGHGTPRRAGAPIIPRRVPGRLKGNAGRSMMSGESDESLSAQPARLPRPSEELTKMHTDKWALSVLHLCSSVVNPPLLARIEADLTEASGWSSSTGATRGAGRLDRLGLRRDRLRQPRRGLRRLAVGGLGRAVQLGDSSRAGAKSGFAFRPARPENKTTQDVA